MRLPGGARRRLASSDVLVALGVAALYVLAAKLGFLFSLQAQQVSAVWPPTGLALAATLRLGRRALPGVWLGAFLANATAAEPLGVAAGIAVGNMLEALAGAELLRWAGFDGRLARLRDVAALLGAAAAVPVVSAAIGVASLGLGGVQRADRLASLGLVWWLGDALGALVIAPPLLAWTGGDVFPHRRGAVAEAAALLGGAVVASAAFFFGQGPTARISEYTFFPLLFWAALRFGPAVTVSLTAVAYAAASCATVAGFGPFAGAGPESGLVLLQLFMAVSAATGMVLGAVAAQRRRAEQSAAMNQDRLLLALAAARMNDRRKNEFLAMLAHELRNPLAPILHAVDLLDGPLAPGDAPRWRQVIRRQAQHLTRIVDDLLDVARITRGAVRLDRRRVALPEVVAAVVETFRPLAAARRQSLSVTLPPYPVWLDADPTRLAQVLSNLLHNAMKFTPEGGRIELSAAEEAGQVVLRVRDDGEGMTPELLGRAFDLFAQGGAPLDRTQGGLGLGLTLVRQLVELHGGSATAASAGPGQGSELTVRLPAAPAPAAPAEPAAVAPAADGAAATAPAEPVGVAPATSPAPGGGDPPGSAGRPRPLRVLVVDDNADALESLALLLRIDGHEVRTAADGPGAVAAAKEFAPEAVLLDLGLPVLDGYGVAAALRQLPGGAGAFIVAVTGYGQADDVARSHAAGIDLHLVKPVEPDHIRELLRQLPPSSEGKAAEPGAARLPARI
jgi:signal transduction histidine kinase/ActR/RegA family two-component response regulator